MNPLLQTLLNADLKQVDGLSSTQILALCGNGKLTDGSPCSAQFREYLQVAKSDSLFTYLRSALEESSESGPFILQDVVNELGRRLDYTVENGAYRGKSNAIGFDGIWRDARGRSLVIEVKTTDTYRINLDTVVKYRETLKNTERVKDDASVLIVVGRQDTGDLEAHVRGSKHAWTIRIISAEALCTLVALKESTEQPRSVERIHELLIPIEYTKLDKIIDIAFTVTNDATAVLEEEHGPLAPEVGPADGVVFAKQQHTPPEIVADIRVKILAALSRQYSPLVKKSRALYWSADKALRVVVTISKKYEDSGYWYAYHLSWDVFLSEGKRGFYVLGCVGRDDAFAIPYDWIHSKLGFLNATERGEGKHWHILLYPSDNGQLILRLNNATSESLEEFKVVLRDL